MQYKKGYITLLSVVIFSVVSVTIVTAVLFLGAQSLSSARDQELAGYGRMLVDACTEEALEQIRSSDAYTGVNSISFAQGSCSATVSNAGGENRTIDASSTTGTIVRKVLVEIDQISPTIHIVSWSDNS